MRSPTRRELEILRYLAVGMTFGETTSDFKTYPVEAKGVEVTSVQRATIAQLLAHGWICPNRDGYVVERNPDNTVRVPDEHFVLTRLGRDVAEVKAFVRAFAEDHRR
jgi:hypothetical protein